MIAAEFLAHFKDTPSVKGVIVRLTGSMTQNFLTPLENHTVQVHTDEDDLMRRLVQSPFYRGSQSTLAKEPILEHGAINGSISPVKHCLVFHFFGPPSPLPLVSLLA